jgi:transposase, IS5 family
MAGFSPPRRTPRLPSSARGHQEPASRHTRRRLERYRTGAEGRVSQLKRRYGLDRSRLKGDEGEQIWTEWAILAYNTDTLAVRER